MFYIFPFFSLLVYSREVCPCATLLCWKAKREIHTFFQRFSLVFASRDDVCNPPTNLFCLFDLLSPRKRLLFFDFKTRQQEAVTSDSFTPQLLYYQKIFLLRFNTSNNSKLFYERFVTVEVTWSRQHKEISACWGEGLDVKTQP